MAWHSKISVTSTSRIGLALLASMMLSTAVYSEPQAEAARQQIQQAMASGNVQSVIESLPALENMWPQSMGEYFQSAEEIARFLGDAGDNPAVQQALDDLFTEVMNKRCPEDGSLVQAAAYFDRKSKIVGYYFGFEETSYGKPRLLLISRFLGEIRDWRIPNYEIRGKQIPGRDILGEAGVSSASSLTNPVQIEAINNAVKENERDMEMNVLQLALFSADSGVTFKLLGSCKQLRRNGNLDEEFANEVAKNSHMTEKEREMRSPFDKSK